MNIGLIAVDSTFPNLALMKIARYHRNRGDTVEWYTPFDQYDKVYMAKVFSYTEDYGQYITNAKEIIKGGTGYDLTTTLPDEIDRLQPDYSIYPSIDKKTAYGFLTRGCPNRCKWCVVPKKEGKVKPYMDVDEIAIDGRTNLILMDNNVLASDFGLEQIEIAVKKGYKIDFNQGLDARLITDDIAKLLASAKWLTYIRVACDQSSQIKHVEKANELLRKHGYTKELFCYCLLQDFNESYERLKYLYQYRGQITPHCQGYRNFDDKHQILPTWQTDMMRWANKRQLYKLIWVDDYEPRKGFSFSKYHDIFNTRYKARHSECITSNANLTQLSIF